MASVARNIWLHSVARITPEALSADTPQHPADNRHAVTRSTPRRPAQCFGSSTSTPLLFAFTSFSS